MSRRSGIIVLTKRGYRGIAYHDEEPVNGKMCVRVVFKGGKKVNFLCDPAGLTILGYID